MIWKLNGNVMKTPTTYKDNIEDLESDSYTSKITGALIDNVIAKGLIKAEFSWDYLTETEAEEILQATYQNPMLITLKCPSVNGGILTAPFRCSKRTSEMIDTEQSEDASKSHWKVSFGIVQKSIVDIQKD